MYIVQSTESARTAHTHTQTRKKPTNGRIFIYLLHQQIAQYHCYYDYFAFSLAKRTFKTVVFLSCGHRRFFNHCSLSRWCRSYFQNCRFVSLLSINVFILIVFFLSCALLIWYINFMCRSYGRYCQQLVPSMTMHTSQWLNEKWYEKCGQKLHHNQQQRKELKIKINK